VSRGTDRPETARGKFKGARPDLVIHETGPAEFSGQYEAVGIHAVRKRLFERVIYPARVGENAG